MDKSITLQKKLNQDLYVVQGFIEMEKDLTNIYLGYKYFPPKLKTGAKDIVKEKSELILQMSVNQKDKEVLAKINSDFNYREYKKTEKKIVRTLTRLQKHLLHLMKRLVKRIDTPEVEELYSPELVTEISIGINDVVRIYSNLLSKKIKLNENLEIFSKMVESFYDYMLKINEATMKSSEGENIDSVLRELMLAHGETIFYATKIGIFESEERLSAKLSDREVKELLRGSKLLALNS